MNLTKFIKCNAKNMLPILLGTYINVIPLQPNTWVPKHYYVSPITRYNRYKG